MVRDAVAAGVDPADAIVMASFHPAQWHGLDRHGAVAPGYVADLLVLPDLERFVPDARAEARSPLEDVPRAEVPDWVRQTVRLRPVTAPTSRSRGRAARRGRSGSSPTRSSRSRSTREPLVVDGHAVSDPRTRPRQARRRRAAPRHGADRPRLPLGLGPAARGARVDRRPRRAQPRRRRRDRRRHGLRRRSGWPRWAAASSSSTAARSSPSARCPSRACSPTSRSTSSSRRAAPATRRRTALGWRARRRS